VAQTFQAQIDAWVAKSQRRIEAVTKESAQRVMLEANHGVPIDTGFAQASFMATLNAPTAQVTFRPSGGGSFQRDDGAVALVIAGMDVGSDVIFGTWTASYVRYLEYGARGRPPIGFLRKAAQRWPAIVAEVTREAKARVG
jgi:hypothetical protein